MVGSGGHVACTLVGPDGGRLRAIAFRCADQPVGQALLRRDALLHVAGTLRLDRWNGNVRVQLFDRGRGARSGGRKALDFRGRCG